MSWWIWALIILGILIVWILVTDYLNKDLGSEGVGTKLKNVGTKLMNFVYHCCGGRK